MQFPAAVELAADEARLLATDELPDDLTLLLEDLLLLTIELAAEDFELLAEDLDELATELTAEELLEDLMLEEAPPTIP